MNLIVGVYTVEEVVRVGEPMFDQGVEERECAGVKFRVYSAARTVARFKNLAKEKKLVYNNDSQA